MEGSESEAVFESLNLNPQLFINEVLNSVDNLVEDAFSYFDQQASVILKTDGTDRSDELTKGVAYVQNMIQSNLNKRLSMWEKYCLSHCFAVPEGFSLPKANETSGDASLDLDALADSELDVQLDSLREKINLVGQECAELNMEIQRVEKESMSINHSAASIEEALQLYEKHSMHEMFQELTESSSEFLEKVKKLKSSRIEKIEHGNGFGVPNAKLEELQATLDVIKT